MIRSSNKRQDLLSRLQTLIPEAQATTHSADQAAATRLGLNLTDLRCLGIVLDADAVSPSDLATAVGLSRGAMTTALDRLETAGLIRRVKHQPDRRSVRIEATAKARRAVETIWAPIRTEGLSLLDGYTDHELAVLVRFFEDYCALQTAHAERLRRTRRK